jgi:gluconolactonase
MKVRFKYAAAFSLTVYAAVSALAQEAPIKPMQLNAASFSRQAEFFAPGAQLETVFSGGCGVMEGMATASDGRIFFTEIMRSTACSDARGVPGGRIWTYDPRSGQSKLFREPSNMAAGLTIDRDGGLVVAEGADFGGRRVSRTDLASGEYRVIGYLFENRQLNAPNDVAVDAQGRVYFSDIRLFGPENIEQRINGVYRIDAQPAGGKGLRPITRIIANNAKINGVELSRDARTLYAGLCELGSNAVDEQGVPDIPRNGPGGLLAYPLDSQGNVGKPRVLLDLENAGCVDGMATDERGHLFVTVNAAPAVRGVYVFAQDRLVARYQLPNNEIAVNVTVGVGQDAGSLYIATLGIGKIYRLKLAGAH